MVNMQTLTIADTNLILSSVVVSIEIEIAKVNSHAIICTSIEIPNLINGSRCGSNKCLS